MGGGGAAPSRRSAPRAAVRGPSGVGDRRHTKVGGSDGRGGGRLGAAGRRTRGARRVGRARARLAEALVGRWRVRGEFGGAAVRAPWATSAGRRGGRRPGP